MRVDAVVEAPPFLDHHPGLCHAEKHLLVEAFIAQSVVEALMLPSGRTPSEHVAFGTSEAVPENGARGVVMMW